MNNRIMFIVGLIIFIIYVYFLLSIIRKQNKNDIDDNYLSPDSNDFGSLIPRRAKSINRVNSTATCAIILFWFLIPPLQANRIAPKTVGIRAVTEDTSI